MRKTIITLGTIMLMFTGCASVPTANPEIAQQLKQFSTPADGQASLYLYRENSLVGATLKKDLWVNGECVGESSRGVFFQVDVEGNKEHQISTESEFSPNTLKLNTEAGKIYFVQQYIKPGVVVGGANLKTVDEATGKAAVLKLQPANKGNCSKAFSQ